MSIYVVMELTGTIAAIVATILNVRKNKLCWVGWGISALMFGILFFSRGLYYAMILQMFYQVMNVIGYVRWKRDDRSS